jgi:magnesium-transporting ATPase (P-type)
MLLLINLLGDGVPGLSLAKEVADPDLMKNKPIKKDESLFGGGLLTRIAQQVFFTTLASLAGYYIGAMDEFGAILPSDKTGQTMAFLICGWASIIHIFIARTQKSVFKTSIRNNTSLAMGAVIMILVFALMVALPPFGAMFGLVPISGFHWLVAIGLAFVPITSREVLRFLMGISNLIKVR